jgi:hypothetical protein
VRRSTLLAAALLSLTPAAAIGHARAMRAADCEALGRLRLADVTLEIAQPVEPGAYTAPDGQSHAVPAFCRAAGIARPSRASEVRFELWMPAAGWNGRYYQLGNGGFAGWIHYPSLAAELRRLNAVALTDTGHRASGGDASWALGRPELLVDYGYRSLKATTDAAKALVHAYYKVPAQRSYFVGCSNGGRQALMAAQRYPGDWDGVLAGAPGNDWTRQFTATAWMQQALRRDARSWIPASKVAAIQQAAVASCSAEARVVDGIPTDPRHCAFDPATLACSRHETDACLTVEQAAALGRIANGLHDAAGGARIFHGFEPTGAVDGDWGSTMLDSQSRAGTQLGFVEQFFRYMVFEDPAWTVAALDPLRDLAHARARQVAGETLEQVLDATSPDLAPFAERGSKLVVYFGWADALFAPRAAIEYYERVAERMGGTDPTREFFRLFMVPGMGHCQGGSAPNAFGQAGIVPGLRDDPAHDIRRALETWVERGVAPERIIAAKFVNDDPLRGSVAVRTLCPYPDLGEC